MMNRTRLWNAFRTAALRTAAWPFRVAAARAAMSALARMDGRELADVGLTRSDLRDVSALALDRDPTVLLALRARERRRDAIGPPHWSGERQSLAPKPKAPIPAADRSNRDRQDERRAKSAPGVLTGNADCRARAG